MDVPNRISIQVVDSTVHYNTIKLVWEVHLRLT